MSSRRRGDSEGVWSGPLSIDATSQGLTVFDAVERHQCTLWADGDVEPTVADPDRFLFPVDAAVSVETSKLSLPNGPAVFVRTADGETVAEATPPAEVTVGPGTYSIELAAAVKLYIRASGPLTVSTSVGEVGVELADEGEILVGARSRHENPAGTITTTTDPVDMMAAVSHLGSALKTTTPERSYPTLRGHPPLVELGDEFSVPDSVTEPDNDVRLELPAEYRSIYVGAPLAYYLGATMEPAPAPRLVVGDGAFEHRFDTHRGFEAEVERVLKQVFVLDCVTRTEGLYQVDLHEREELETVVDLDFDELYDADLATQLETYLEVDYDVVEPYVPDWKQTTHVSPDPSSVELLPFVVNDLAVVRSPTTRELGDNDLQTAAVRDFMRGDGGTQSRGLNDDTPHTVRPEQVDSVEQSWVGEGAPLGASKPTTAAFRNGLDRDHSDGDIDITVVCNDEEMDAEGDVVDDAYGRRDDLPFDVTVHRHLTTDELRDVLAASTDFFHFIGHIDGDGFKCADGLLDAADLDHVGVDAFFLNACQSYGQGMSLLEKGSISGVATVRDVVNRGAEAIGKTIAHLLNRGFTLNAALDVASDESIMSNRYVVIGDGTFALTQSESRTPIVYEVEEADTRSDDYRLTLHAYPTSDAGMGSMFIPFVEDHYYLNTGRVDSFTLSETELLDFLQLEDVPIKIDGELHWSSDLPEFLF